MATYSATEEVLGTDRQPHLTRSSGRSLIHATPAARELMSAVAYIRCKVDVLTGESSTSSTCASD
jgi:hypothetical protein